MAKETNIIFVYDTTLLQREEDDPASAILYFHPTWVSDQQKTALCGQIIGTIRCLKTIFTSPKIVSLQTGKFYVIENDKYLLVIGTDRNILDGTLEYRAKILYSLVNFFHRDFAVLSKLYTNVESFSAKLYHMFDTYLKMLMFKGTIFSHTSTIQLPKAGSVVFRDRMHHILQFCQTFNDVLGGAIMFHNKVVATQLSSDLSKTLVLADLHRIKSPAEVVEVDYELPLGAKLLYVYVSSKEYNNLLEISVKNRNNFNKKNNKMQDAIISQIKQDLSLIFNREPEKNSNHMPISKKPIAAAPKRARPNFLNIKCISVDSSTVEMIPIVTPTDTKLSPTETSLNDIKNKENFDKLLLKHQPYMTIKEDIHNLKKYFSMNSICNKKYLTGIKDNRCKTINDPTFPVFKNDGTPVSSSMYHCNIVKHTETVKKDDNNAFKNFDLILDLNNTVQKKVDNQNTEIKLRPKLENNNKENRKSLTLPLKSLSMDSPDQNQTKLNNINNKPSGGVLLTPLMTKLSILALEERSSPCDYKGLKPTQPNFSYPFVKLKTNKEADSPKSPKENKDDGLQKCVLFVCGHQHMVLTVLIGEAGVKDSEVIYSLWRICTEHLAKIEKQLHLSMESQLGDNHEHELYSFLCLDGDWGTVHKGGPWEGNSDFGALSNLHQNFSDSNITDILIRGPDSITYSKNCDQGEVFYHENASANLGLPPPTDIMGAVQFKAERRLERDHGIILD